MAGNLGYPPAMSGIVLAGRIIEQTLAGGARTAIKSTLGETLAILERAADAADTDGTSTAARALAAVLVSDRIGFAVLGGYEAAMRRLLAPKAVRRASFCVTEAGGGAHPSATTTRIENRGDAWFVTGVKSFATLASHAEVFIVIGATGAAEAGRKPLRAALIERGAPGLVLAPRAALPFVPEVPHCALELTDVRATELLPGDGYERYVKPFRTVEDAHVTLAVTGYALAEATAHGWDQTSLRAVIGELATIADDADPTLAETHRALDAALGRARVALEGLPWDRAPGDIGARWLRDRAILDVASKARAKRAERARERLDAG